MSFRNHIIRFLANTSGQISVIACIVALPMIGAVGLGIDYSYMASVKAELQKEADVEALERRGGRWISETVYQVDKEKTVKTYFMGIMGQSKATVLATAQTMLKDPVWSFDPASVIPIDGNANDYNVTGFYCYNPETNVRHTFTDMADNRGGKFLVQQTTCEIGDEIEFYMKNYALTIGGSREILSNPCISDPDDTCEVNYFFTDKGDKGNIPFTGAKHKNAAVETVLCDPLSSCIRMPCAPDKAYVCVNYKGYGGKIPHGIHRKPLNEKQLCEPGKYIYYGWEDTPVQRKVWGGDFDYDDYSMVVSCPTYSHKDGKSVYIIK